MKDQTGAAVAVLWSGAGTSHAGDDFDARADVEVTMPFDPSAGAPSCTLVFHHNGTVAGYGGAPNVTAAVITGWSF